MKSKSLAWLGVIVAICFVAPGCSTDRNDFVTPTSEAVGPMLGFVADQTVINNFNVHFDGRTVSGGNTTFAYTVSGTGVDPSMSHFTIELPPCAGAPVSYSPVGGANINTNQQSGVYGLQWHSSIDENNLVGVQFSVTFAGDVPLGIVRSEVKTDGGVWATGYVFGPCAGSHVAGSVFVDADNNGIHGIGEGGISNVTVTITDGEGSQSAVTDASGNYDFLVGPGTYTVAVAPSTPANDFNEDLFASFVYDVTSRTVTVGSNEVADADFGFEPKSDKIVADLEAGLLLTTGKPVRYWKSALRGGKNAPYTPAQLVAFLQQIETLGVPDPFQFGAGTEIAEAYAILSDNRRDLEVRLRKELLASELNFVSGKSIVGETDLHEVLLLWCEQVLGPSTPPAGVIVPMAIRDISEGESAVGLLGTLNGSTGGGGTDE
ncbi:MAG TPA: SdrD B-like domain-containing protein [Candidatus Krumholzibacteria bacterium]|nr:SdrD B-like domain-containing protein [Candidatus Krumholzibacteria bacterium]